MIIIISRIITIVFVNDHNICLHSDLFKFLKYNLKIYINVIIFLNSISIVNSMFQTIPRKRLNHPDNFCYICGEITFKSQRRHITPLIKKCYERYFRYLADDLDKNWTPNICCVSCVRLPTGWRKGTHHMHFAIPMIWRKPTNHTSDCYFCLSQIKGFTSKTKCRMKYPNVHSTEFPVPVCSDVKLNDETESDEKFKLNLII